MATINNAFVSLNIQHNRECESDSGGTEGCSTVSDAPGPEKGVQKSGLNCMISDEAVQMLETAFMTVVVVFMVGLLSLPSMIFFVSYCKSTKKDTRNRY